MMSIQPRLYTAEEFDEFAELPENRDKKLEFIDGEIIEVPSNVYSSEISSIIIRLLGNFVYERKLGHVTGEQGGYMIAGARIAPDVAFISKSKRFTRKGYNPDPPDLAIEVMSPDDKPEDLEKKLRKYAEARVLVWVFYPEDKTVKVHAPDLPEQTLSIDDTLSGGDVLPGFTLAVKDVFPEEE